MTNKRWNWMLKQWPHFSYDKEVLAELEFTFSQNSGTILGVFRHIQGISKDDFIVEILSNEALKTSEIEGENLDRESLQSSIKKHLGLSVENRKVSPAEYGISEMMVDLYLNFNTPISHALLYQWHEMITNGRRDLANIGQYRTHEAPMQIVSGSIDNPKIHFEAPPSKEVFNEMEQFINWFNSEHDRSEKSKFFPLAKAGISHLYFESIHPFEDGNGRIGRAIAEKSIAMSLKQPSLISLSHTIEIHKKNYYQSLEKSNITLEITDWLVYFGRTILDAQQHTLKQIEFLIEKAKFFDRFSPLLNERQMKVVKRLFEAGHTGFIGGLSADNYQRIAKTSASTATRDLQELVQNNILLKTGVLKGSRYFLNIKTK